MQVLRWFGMIVACGTATAQCDDPSSNCLIVMFHAKLGSDTILLNRLPS